jgi:four helix bundle protein
VNRSTKIKLNINNVSDSELKERPFTVPGSRKEKMDHKELDAWKISIDFVAEIYKVTDSFPSSEIYGLTNQIRRAAVSIPSNISEGAAKYSDKDTSKFLYNALGSAAELETQLIIARKIGYLEEEKELIETIQRIQKLILGMIKYLKNKNK